VFRGCGKLSFFLSSLSMILCGKVGQSGREGLSGAEGCALCLGAVRTAGWLIDKDGLGDGMENTPER